MTDCNGQSSYPSAVSTHDIPHTNGVQENDSLKDGEYSVFTVENSPVVHFMWRFKCNESAASLLTTFYCYTLPITYY